MLPNLNMPEFVTSIPSSDKEVFFRPFLVKEEKILLIALESGDAKEIENAILTVLCNCVNMDVEEVLDLPSFDIEHLFLQLRSKSISDITTVKLGHQNITDCDHRTSVDINLNDVKVVFPENHQTKIMLTDSVGVSMKYPSLRESYTLGDKLNNSNVESVFDFISENVEYIFDNDSVYDDATHEEIAEFIGNVNKEQFSKILDFYNTMPTASYDCEFVCEKCNTKESIQIRGMNNFFS